MDLVIVKAMRFRDCLKVIGLGLFIITGLLCCSGGGGGNGDDDDDNDDDDTNRVATLNSITTWMYQIQELDQDGAVDALAATDYPLLVLEPTYNNVGSEDFDVSGMISTLRTTSGGTRRLLLAYIDIGQAEDYRTYWQSSWVAPTATQRGDPDFLVTTDPDGWSGNYPVAYWDTDWQDIWLGSNGLIAALANLGFDGVYLDWVEAYDDEKVMEVADADGINAPNAMVSFISAIRQAGRAVISDFLVIGQNAPYLLDDATSDYAAVIDALAMEDTWFSGAGDADWDDANAGDIANDNTDRFATDQLLTQYEDYLNRSLPVFTVDYCISQSNATQVYQDSSAAGLIPLVTRVSLSQVTETPPP